jgi:molybdate transport system substrate-binding protein
MRSVYASRRLLASVRSLAALLLTALMVVACASSAAPAPAPTTAPSGAASATTPAASTQQKIGGELTVFAAASLTDPFKEIGTKLESANPGAKINFNFAGSSQLRTQLKEGAKADVFAVADEPNMQGAQKEGTIAGDSQIFIKNKLVVIVSNKSTAGVAEFKDLAKSGVKLVMGQKELPAGNYARQILAKASADSSYGKDFGDNVLKNLSSEENNVKNVVSKVQLGEADAGFCFSSDVTAKVKGDVKVIPIPEAFAIIAQYPVAVVKGAPNETSAKAFIDYLLSPDGQAVLSSYGFIALK